jgi:crotonobetainyl-CoA:carnitine CoA-transferase CaiB-like acyl-CoA transferase
MTENRNNNNSNLFPLQGIRVLEYGVFHAGPGAGAILGDLGAEVIKIEALAGDPARFWTRLGRLDMTMPNGDNATFHYSNRNKRSICLDIKSLSGRKIFERLVARTDVFLTNVRQSTKKKLRIDYPALKDLNPRMIHANVSGYGPEGAMADLGAFDPLGLARSGLAYATGAPDPKLMHIGLLDQATSIAASHAVVTALFARERSGMGQEVHISLYSTGQWLNGIALMINSLLGIDPIVPEERTTHPPLRNRYLCKDGKWLICTHHPEEKYWSLFCEAIGQGQWLSDPRFAETESRRANQAELITLLDGVFMTRTSAEWMEIFIEKGLMFCPVQRVPEILKDPQALDNGYIVDYKDPRFGKLCLAGYPIHFSEYSAGTRSLAPGLGQHTQEVLREVGYSGEEIEGFKKEGAVH